MGNRGNGSRCGRGGVALVVLRLWLAGTAAAVLPLHGETPALRWGALGLRGAGELSLAPAAGGGGILWACTYGDGVWKSLDGGASWTRQQLELRDTYCLVAADPVDPLTAYAYGSVGVAKTGDGGITWRTINSMPAQAFAIAPSAPNVLYVAGLGYIGQGGPISRSDDGGATWKPVAALEAPLEGPWELTVDPTDPNDVYGVGAAFHLDASPIFVRSIDGGMTWNIPGPVPDGLSTPAIDPRQPATIYAAAFRLRMLRSRDHGASWESANAGLPAADWTGPLAFDPASGALFLATHVFYPQSASRIWKSTDGGDSWSLVLERDDDHIQTLAVDRGLPGRIYATSYRAALLASSDGGAHWKVANPSFTPAAIDDLVFAAGVPGSLFAAAHSLAALGVEKSTDFGATWQSANQGLPDNGGPVWIDHLAADRVGALYAEARGNFFATRDGGQTWLTRGSNLAVGPLDVAAGPVAAQLFAVGPIGNEQEQQSGVERSLDGGVTWTKVLTVSGAGGLRPDKLSSLLVDFAVFAGGRGGLYKSQDGGQTWTAIGAGLPADQAIVRLRADAAHHLYAVLEPGAHQMFRSTDHGNTWTAIEAGLPAAVPVTDLAADPSGKALYAGTGAGVYVSLDGGAHWAAQNDGLGDLRVTRLVADPARPGVVYAGTAGGLYVLPAPASPCQSADGVLCLASGRFAAQVVWSSQDGKGGAGHAAPLTGGPDGANGSGGFWFFGPNSTELVVKLVDGRTVNGHYWVFVAGVSDVAYSLTLTDTVTGARHVYTNPQGWLASFADTGTFAAASGRSAGAGPAADLPVDLAPVRVRRGEVAPAAAAGQACGPASAKLCLAASRFAVQIAWQLPGGAPTPARAVPLTTDTGIFWFFSPTSLELIVKVLDGRALNGHFWVFVAGLSDLAYTAAVTDTVTGETRSYVHRAGGLTSMADTSF